ncbi:Do/DeqQ family serine protease [Litoreibacter ascidiaceicola]|uniref:Do/DeqQ family serine protease n=1 Tax=Litoreibacter ascidiaceicola TaxID=1486859 RepID=A0A1M4XN09_9RHOB|nr:trypsin-like peptidase domain-containing protein [Litoreibacter ascidiaceicola]SHE94869.1 Do/DeqQ family serine protease [Litoreibacter ascidiaceicola]
MRLFLPVLLSLVLAMPATAEVKVPQSQTEISLSFAPLVKEAAPAVVNIFANRIVQQSESPFRGNPLFEELFRGFGQSQPRVQNSLGSGVIVSDDGIVVSNYHVVGMATEIRVVLTDRREFEAEILLADQDSDLAILKINADTPLPHLDFRDSDEVEVGELALAIGNPFGIGQTVTSGIVSGLARSGTATGNARGYYLQTDAAINPGNSGGALVDVSGRLIGINTSILTRSGGSNGVGFAIPANLVARYVEQARAGNDSFTQAWAGIFGQAVDSSLAEGFGLSVPEGVVISSMHPVSPFAEAGLALGDIVLSVDGQPVNSPPEMLFRMSVRPVGEAIAVEYLSDGEVKEAEVALIEAPDTPPRDARMVQDGTLAGLAVANINPAVQSELNLPTAIFEGVVVTEVSGPLARVGLRAGDVLVAINGDEIETTADVEEASDARSRNWRIDGLRGGQRFSYRFRI